jgi:hypothetical protein
VLGCALEGGLLLALFATAGVLEAQLAGSARGDLKALWASVPKTANAVQVHPPICRLRLTHTHARLDALFGSIWIGLPTLPTLQVSLRTSSHSSRATGAHTTWQGVRRLALNAVSAWKRWVWPSRTH